MHKPHLHRLPFACLLLALAICCPRASAADAPPRWIVITAPAFRNAIEPLRQHRVAEGFQVTVLNTTDILTPEDLQHGNSRKLRDHLATLLQQPGGRPYVLLVGVPRSAKPEDAQATVVPILPGAVGRMKNQPTDNGYGCLGPDLLPTVAVGRLPARTADEARQMVDKILAYESDGQTQFWRRSLTLLVGDPGARSPAERIMANAFVSSSSRLAAQQLNPSWSLRGIFHVPDSPWYVPDETLHDKTLQFLQQGQAFVFYLGHSGDSGFWSAGAPFFSRDDWAALRVPHGAGIFVTCGCFSCQLDSSAHEDHEGYGLAALRNPGGPVAVIGAHGESYAAMGQLAFNGLLRDLAAPTLPERLGDTFLHLKAGLANGPIDPLTFTMLDYADGSSGKISLAIQRQEHLEMWMLLGDPALHLPLITPEITLETAATAAPGATVTLRGKLPPALAEARLRITVERPPSGQPQNLQAVPDAPPEARARAILANHARANDPVLLKMETTARNGTFEISAALPKSLPWPHIVLRASTVPPEIQAMGVVAIKVLLAPASSPAAPPATRPTPALPDDGKTPLTIVQVPIRKIEPPEKEFYAKRLDYRGLPIKGAAVVSDEAFYEAWRRIDNLLKHNPVILQNLLLAGSEVHIIGKDQSQTDLPEFRSQKGVPLRENPRMTLDERARGMGGRECSCGEENLLKLPNDRYRGRDILSHEFTHTIHGYGVSPNIRQRVTQTYQAARQKKLWELPDGKPIYAGSNENEYLAELALWYVGGRGDWPKGMGPMEPGPEFIKKYDSEGYKLVDDLFSGRADVQPVTPRSRGPRGNRGVAPATAPTTAPAAAPAHPPTPT